MKCSKIVNAPDDSMFHRAYLRRPVRVQRGDRLSFSLGDVSEPFEIEAPGSAYVEYVHINLVTREAHLDDPWQREDGFTVDLVTGAVEYNEEA